MEKFKPYKMKDIAKMAGVSIASVSNAINNSRNVKEDTKKKILKIVQELNYKPNLNASSLKTKHNKVVSIIMPDISNPVFAQHIEGIEEVVRNSDYEVLVAFTYYDILNEKTYFEDLFGRTSGGFIFVSGFNNRKYIMDLVDNNVKLVLLDREFTEKKIPSVTIDNFTAMKDMVNYFIKNGHTRICYITYPHENLVAVKKRFEGYLAALKENNIDYDPEIVIIDDSLILNELNCEYIRLKEILKSKKLPTLLITASDYIGIAVIKLLKQMKIKIPDDISVAGYDNITMSNYIEPSLTTVSQPARAMGKAAMQLMIDLLEDKKNINKNIVFPTEFIERESTKRL